MRSPFLLYKRETKGGPVWYARFLDEKTGRYSITRSLEIKANAKRSKAAATFKAHSLLGTLEEKKASPLFVDYLAALWADDSTYVKSKALAMGRPFSSVYLENNRRNVRIHIAPYPPFTRVKLEALSTAMLQEWQVWAASRGLGARGLNAALQTIKVGLRWAFERGDIASDPSARLRNVHYERGEKGALTRAEVYRLIEANESDPRARGAILLLFLCGLRRGEVRGLRWGDIEEGGILDIRHNYVPEAGERPPKWGSARRVPAPQAILEAFEAVKSITTWTAADDFVFSSLEARDIPIREGFIEGAFKRMMRAIGIDDEARKARGLSPHSGRHTFISLAREIGIPDATVQALAGHRSAAMMAKYSQSAKVLDFEAERKRLDESYKIKAASL